MVLPNRNVMLLLSAIVLYIHSGFQASAQDINGQCVLGCFSPAGNPLATPAACNAGALITQQPTPSAFNPAVVQSSCICAGAPGYVFIGFLDLLLRIDRGTYYCTICGTTLTPGYIQSHCPEGGIPGPSSIPPPTCVYPNHKYTEPSMSGYGPVTTDIHQKLVDASELASIAYCTQPGQGQLTSAPLNTWQCRRFCADFPGMKILLVSHE
jgi:hypothetical protein